MFESGRLKNARLKELYGVTLHFCENFRKYLKTPDLDFNPGPVPTKRKIPVKTTVSKSKIVAESPVAAYIRGGKPNTSQKLNITGSSSAWFSLHHPYLYQIYENNKQDIM